MVGWPLMLWLHPYLPISFAFFLLFKMSLSLPNFLLALCFVSFPYPFLPVLSLKVLPLSPLCPRSTYIMWRGLQQPDSRSTFRAASHEKWQRPILTGLFVPQTLFLGFMCSWKYSWFGTQWINIYLTKRRMPAIWKLKQTNSLLIKLSIADIILVLLMDSVCLCNRLPARL